MAKLTQKELDKILEAHEKWDANQGAFSPLPGSDPNPAKRAELERMDLSGLNFESMNLNGANLNRANLSGAKMKGVSLRNCDLFMANFSEADLQEADLSFSSVYAADFSGADLSEADCTHSDFSESKFVRAGVHHVNFMQSNLRETDFSGAAATFTGFYECDLRMANFTGADLSDSNFTAAQIHDAEFKDAKIIGTVFVNTVGEPKNRILTKFKDFDLPTEPSSEAHDFLNRLKKKVGAKMTRNEVYDILTQHWDWLVGKEGKQADLSGADLSGLTLTDLSFSKTKLIGTNFRNCELRGSIFTNAELNNAIFTRANLFQVNFYRANVSGANFEEANLEEATLHYALAVGADFSGADLTAVIGTQTNFSKANFHVAELDNAQLDDTNLSGANFADANLYDVFLHNADISGANFSGANLTKTDFEGIDTRNIDFSEAKNVDKAWNLTPSFTTYKDMELPHETSSEATDFLNRLKKKVGESAKKFEVLNNKLHLTDDTIKSISDRRKSEDWPITVDYPVTPIDQFQVSGSFKQYMILPNGKTVVHLNWSHDDFADQLNEDLHDMERDGWIRMGWETHGDSQLYFQVANVERHADTLDRIITNNLNLLDDVSITDISGSGEHGADFLEFTKKEYEDANFSVLKMKAKIKQKERLRSVAGAEQMGGLYQKALEFATKAHEGQKDKIGEDYILHPIAVSQKVMHLGDEIAAAAVLHDVCEDCNVSLEDLRTAGFPPKVVTLVDALTRRQGEKYFDYIQRVKESGPDAVAIKIQDIKHNDTEPRSLPFGGDKGTMHERYQKALKILLGSIASGSKKIAVGPPELSDPNFVSRVIDESNFPGSAAINHKCSDLSCIPKHGRGWLFPEGNLNVAVGRHEDLMGNLAYKLRKSIGYETMLRAGWVRFDAADSFNEAAFSVPDDRQKYMDVVDKLWMKNEWPKIVIEFLYPPAWTRKIHHILWLKDFNGDVLAQMKEQRLLAKKRKAQFWEDLSDEQKQQHRDSVLKALQDLETRKYPFEALFGNHEKITVLGPVNNFEPYASHPAKSKAPASGGSMLCEFSDGRQAIMMATQLFENGKPLLPKSYKTKTPDFWDRAKKDPESVFQIKKKSASSTWQSVITDKETGMPFYDSMISQPHLKDYFHYYKGYDFGIQMMSPDQYLDACADMHGMYLVEQNKLDRLREAHEKGAIFPMPVLDYSIGKKGTQEGRHRAYLAKELGVKEIPVFIVRKIEPDPQKWEDIKNQKISEIKAF